MFSPTIIPETYSRGDKTVIELFLSGEKWLGRGSGAAVWMIGKQV